VPETEVATTARLPIQTVWEFVREMDHWAPFLTGYQSHRKESDTDSLWVLKGDVGVLTRTLEFRVHVTEWAGPHRVAFTLEGLNEPLRGSGEFRMEPCEGEEDPAPGPAATRTWLARVFDALARSLFRLFRRGDGHTPGGRSAAGEELVRLRFRLRLDPGGPMAPMVSAMMKPALRPAAEDLAHKIVAHLEASEARALAVIESAGEEGP